MQGFELLLFSFPGASGSSGSSGAPQPVMLKITKSQDELEDDLDEADDDNQNKVIELTLFLILIFFEVYFVAQVCLITQFYFFDFCTIKDQCQKVRF